MLLNLLSLLTPSEPPETPSFVDEGEGIEAMATEADFLNDALGQAGLARINAITDGSIEANWCKTFYPPLRRALLRLHYWNFAEDRASLVAEATPPAFEFQYQYPLPANFVRMKEYNGENLVGQINNVYFWHTMRGRYKLEGRRLLSNESSVKIVYGIDVANPTLWDPLFYQMASTWLAAKLAVAIGKDTSKATAKMQEAISLMLPLAAAVDGQEGTIMPYVSDDLIWGR